MSELLLLTLCIAKLGQVKKKKQTIFLDFQDFGKLFETWKLQNYY